jgi:hypothetical protein
MPRKKEKTTSAKIEDKSQVLEVEKQNIKKRFSLNLSSFPISFLFFLVFLITSTTSFECCFLPETSAKIEDKSQVLEVEKQNIKKQRNTCTQEEKKIKKNGN